jgi:hypothetical protein
MLRHCCTYVLPSIYEYDADLNHARMTWEKKKINMRNANEISVREKKWLQFLCLRSFNLELDLF